MDLKSKKINTSRKTATVWIVTAVVLAAALLMSFMDYSSYRKGQEFGIGCAKIVSEISGESIVSSSDSYEEQCEDFYTYLDRSYYDVTVRGYKFDYSDVRAAMSRVRESLYDLMSDAGFDRYSSYSIADWFKYPSFLAYFTGYSFHQPIMLLAYLVLLFALYWTNSISGKKKKELTISGNTVTCRYSAKKSKDVMIRDITGVETGKDSLKLTGNGIKFKVPMIENAEELKNAIMQKKSEG